MSATYNVVTIGSAEYDVYADLATADEYLEAESGATAWRAATDEDKSRALVTATRQLDRMAWVGEKTDPGQTLEWPRSDTGLSTSLVPDENTIPQRIIDAACVIAMLTVGGADVAGTASTSSGEIKREKAGSVELEYFRAFDVDGTPLPTQAWELVAPLLGGSATAGGAVSFGTDTCSDFSRSYDPSGPY